MPGTLRIFVPRMKCPCRLGKNTDTNFLFTLRKEKNSIVTRTDFFGKSTGLLLALVFLLPSLTVAANITVNCNAGASIGGALKTAKAGDTLLVSGTCLEHVEITEALDGLTLDGQNTTTISGPNPDVNVIQLIGVRGVTVRGFRVTGGRDGISLYGVQRVSLYSNTIESTGRDAIQVQRASSFSDIISNSIQNNPRHGVFINEASSVRIGFAIGIEADADARPNLIQGNGAQGILVSRASSARIHHNWIRNNRQNGISVEQLSHAAISNNAIEGNTLDGILVRQSSAVNLGTDTGNNPDNLPNSTGTPNGQWGIEIIGAGAFADGRLGSLTGVNGPRRYTPDTNDSLLPSP